MECRDTGQLEVVKLPHLTVELAQEIDMMIAETQRSNNGYGQISMKLEKGVVTAIDWMMRRFRNKKQFIN